MIKEIIINNTEELQRISSPLEKYLMTDFIFFILASKKISTCRTQLLRPNAVSANANAFHYPVAEHYLFNSMEKLIIFSPHKFIISHNFAACKDKISVVNKFLLFKQNTALNFL